MGYKQSTYPMQKTALLITYQSALRRSFLWNQELLFSVSSALHITSHNGLEKEKVGLR